MEKLIFEGDSFQEATEKFIAIFAAASLEIEEQGALITILEKYFCPFSDQKFLEFKWEYRNSRRSIKILLKRLIKIISSDFKFDNFEAIKFLDYLEDQLAITNISIGKGENLFLPNDDLRTPNVYSIY